MKKLLLILLALIVVAIAGLPYVNGMIMEKVVTRYFEQVNQMQAETGSDLRVEILNYDRGFSDTLIEWRIDLGSLKSVYKIEEVVFVEEAKHGLLGVSSETNLEKNTWFSDWVATQPAGKNPLVIKTSYPIIGDVTSMLSLDKLTIKTAEQPLDIGALELTVSVDKAFKTISTRGEWAGLFQDDKNGIGPMRFESEQSRVTNIIWQGNGSMSLDKIMINKNDESAVLSDFSLSFDIGTSEDKKDMNIDMGMQLGNIAFENQTLSDWSAQWGIKHIDIQAYEDLFALYSQIANKMITQMADPDISADEVDRILQAAMVMNAPQLMAGCEKLLKKNFQVQVSKLDIELPEGKVKGNLALGLKKDMTVAQFYPILAQPSHALDIFFLKSDLTLPNALVDNRPDLTMPVFSGMTTGLFVKEGAGVHHQAETRENKLYLNGEEVLLN